jgi:signal transduction histidine kinase
VAQEIVGLGYIVDEIESISEQDQTRELAAALRGEITRLVSEIRFSIFDLRHEVAATGLASSLADYAHEVSRASGIQVHLTVAESGPPLPRRTAAEALRVAQEAISNVRKHAEAGNMWVSLESDGCNLSLQVEDDGVGNAAPKDHHWGLQTMKERARSMNARLEITPRARGGTIVTLRTDATVPPEGDHAHEHHRASG